MSELIPPLTKTPTWDEILANRQVSNPAASIVLPEFTDPWRTVTFKGWQEHQRNYCYQHGHDSNCLCQFKHEAGVSHIKPLGEKSEAGDTINIAPAQTKGGVAE